MTPSNFNNSTVINTNDNEVCELSDKALKTNNFKKDQ
jgi:hypothetical protein